MSSGLSPVQRRPEVPYYVKAVGMALPAIMLGLQISGWIFFTAAIRDGHPDFRANYSAGYMVRTGQSQEIYDYDAAEGVQNKIVTPEPVACPFIHPAYEAIFYLPFSFLPFYKAYAAMLLVNLLLLALCYQLIKSHLDGLREIWRPLPLLIFFTYLPIVAALMQGQYSILFLVLTLSAFILLEYSNDFGAGLLLGIGAFRFQLMLPMLFFFLIWKRWRLASGILTSASAAAILSIWIAGISATKFYVRSLAAMSIGGVTELERVRYAQPISHMASLRALVWSLGSGWLSPFWIQAITIALSLLLVLWVARSVPAKSRTSDLLLINVLAAAILSYHMLIHDMTVLLLPISIFASRAVLQGRAGGSVLWTSALLFTAPATIAVAQFHFYIVCISMITLLIALLKIDVFLREAATQPIKTTA